MIMSPRQIEEMTEASKPLMKFLNENFHPHVTIVVKPTTVELLEGSATVMNDEFVKD